MANIGDLVTTLIADANPYEKGTQRAVASNSVLGGSIESIIGRLERQKQAFDRYSKTTRDNILGAAGKGATEGQVNVALQKLEEVEALRKRVKAEQDSAAAKQRSHEAGEKLIETLEREKATVGMTSQELTLYRAKQAGASQADLDRARVLQTQITQLQAAAEAEENLAKRTNLASSGVGGLNRSNLMLTESVRLAEDAVAGFTNNGLRGMLMASTNNVTQLGALAGGTTGLALSVGSIAALVGVSLIPKLNEWATSTEAVAKANEAAERSSERMLSRSLDMMEARHERVTRLNETWAKFNRSLSDLDDSKSIHREITRITDLQSSTGNEQSFLSKKLGLMAEADQRVQEPQRHYEDFKSRDWEGYFNGRIDDKGFEKLIADTEKLNKKKQEFQDSSRELTDTYRRQREYERELEILTKRLEVVKATEKAEEDRKRDEKELKEFNERAQQNNSVRTALADTFRSELSQRSAILAEELQSLQKKREQEEQISNALSRRLISPKDAEQLRDFFGQPKTTALGGPAAAVQSNSTEAYSAIVRAMNKTKQEDLERKQYDEIKQLAPLLEKIERKEAVQIVTLY